LGGDGALDVFGLAIGEPAFAAGRLAAVGRGRWLGRPRGVVSRRPRPFAGLAECQEPLLGEMNVVAVVAFIALPAFRLAHDDAFGQPIEEIAVVADEDERPLVRAERLLERVTGP